MNKEKQPLILSVWIVSLIFFIQVNLVYSNEQSGKYEIEFSSKQQGNFQFTFSDWQGPNLRIWGYKPSQYKPSTPIVFVMHGTRRDADRYRDEWVKFAEDLQFLLVVPQFTREDFPRANGYNLGNVFQNESQVLNPKHLWSYSAIEPIFDDVLNRFDNNTNTYAIYGHSAGSQFVHRYLYFVPDARVSVAIAANAGWYTMPDFEQSFPYGLANTPVSQNILNSLFQQKLIVLLGTADNDPNHRSLRKAPEAMLQGRHRLQRGENFYRMAEIKSRHRGIPFKWQLVYAPDIGHENAKMAAFAAPYLAN